VRALTARAVARTDRFTLLGIAVAAAAFTAQAAAQLVDLWAFDLRVAELDGNSVSSVFSWVSAAALLGTAVAFAGIASVDRKRRATGVAACVLFAFLLLDNRLHIHGRLTHGKLLFLPILGTAFVLLWRFWAKPGRERALVRAGLGLLLLSLVVHLTGPTILSWGGWQATDWQDQLKIALKESAEKAGWILVCFGAAAQFRSSSAERLVPA
jgi:hypothetical protein